MKMVSGDKEIKFVMSLAVVSCKLAVGALRRITASLPRGAGSCYSVHSLYSPYYVIKVSEFRGWVKAAGAIDTHLVSILGMWLVAVLHVKIRSMVALFGG